MLVEVGTGVDGIGAMQTTFEVQSWGVKGLVDKWMDVGVIKEVSLPFGWCDLRYLLIKSMSRTSQDVHNIVSSYVHISVVNSTVLTLDSHCSADRDQPTKHVDRMAKRHQLPAQNTNLRAIRCWQSINGWRE